VAALLRVAPVGVPTSPAARVRALARFRATLFYSSVAAATTYSIEYRYHYYYYDYDYDYDCSSTTRVSL